MSAGRKGGQTEREKEGGESEGRMIIARVRGRTVDEKEIK